MQITNLKKERLTRGWTQQELANQLGITKSMVHSLETLKRRPSYEILIQLHEIFNLPCEDLFQQVSDENSFSPDSYK